MLKTKENSRGRTRGRLEGATAALASLVSTDEKRFRQMIDALPAAIYTTDAKGHITHFNPACIDFSGRTPELGSDHWCVTWKLFYPDGRPMPHGECPMAIALKTGRVVRDAEAIAERPDGTRLWFTPYPTPLFDDAGNIVGGINMLVDITERKQAEEELSRRAEQLAAFMETAALGLHRVGPDGTILWANDAELQMLGYSRDEYVGRHIAEFHADQDVIADMLQRVLRGERLRDHEARLKCKDGSVRIALVDSCGLFRDGHFVHTQCFTRDITEQKRSEQELREAKQEAEDANRSKDRFLAVLSHELRTPLTPVMMSVTAMDLDPDLPPAIRDNIAMIRRNVELEAKLIDDLLDLSRVTAGKLRLNMEPVEMNEAVRHVCQTCRPFILEKGIHLHCDLPDAEHYVKADMARLQQVLWNLIKNAAKFTPERGDIYVTVSGTDAQRVRVEVRDTGFGIAPEILPRIFDAFEQGDANITRQFGGMGLGLAISKALLDMLGGSIRAESRGRHQGATFTVELPALAATDVVRPAAAERHRGNGHAGLRVLVVDDHADTAAVLGRLLGASGYRVRTAGSAAAALELAARETFDVIVSDIGLPDVSGHELLKQIKARYPIKGIAMSGYGTDEDLRKSREAGFSDHIVKPANVAQLERAIRRCAVNGESQERDSF